MGSTNQVRHWSFTWYDTDTTPTWNPDKMTYMVYQPEVCPTTNRPHFQGYVAFKRSMKMGMVKKTLGSKTVHVEVVQGTPEQARHYCMKPVEGCVCHHCMGQGVRIEGGEITEHGTFTFQGKRSDLEEVSKAIKEGKSIKEIASLHTTSAIRYLKGIVSVHKLINVVRRQGEVENVIFYGDTTCYKTTICWNLYGEADIWNDYIGPGWWENYNGQEIALYDEFNGREHMDSSMFKKITDKFPVNVPFKGGSNPYLARVNLFTSNVDPRDWYSRVHWKPIKRRMNHIIYCRKYVDQRMYTCEKCIDECELVGRINNMNFE